MVCFKFLERVYRLLDTVTEEEGYSTQFESLVHKTIKKVSDDYEKMKFNTAIATMMSFVNEINKAGKITKGELKVFLTLLNPVAPHITEEMWEKAGFDGRIYSQKWPEYDESKTIDNEIEIPVQINGKVRATIKVVKDADASTVEKTAFENEDVIKFSTGHEIVKKIYVPGRIFTVVVK